MVESELNVLWFYIEFRSRFIRKEKLSDPSNVSGPAAGGNESRIFQTAPDSNDFGSVSMTVYYFYYIFKVLQWY